MKSLLVEILFILKVLTVVSGVFILVVILPAMAITVVLNFILLMDMMALFYIVIGYVTLVNVFALLLYIRLNM